MVTGLTSPYIDDKLSFSCLISLGCSSLMLCSCVTVALSFNPKSLITMFALNVPSVAPESLLLYIRSRACVIIVRNSLSFSKLF